MQERCVLKKLGIKGRVLLLTLLPTSLMALVLGGYFTWMQQSDLQTQLMQRGEMIAEQLAPLVAPAMGHKNTELLERIATQSLEQPDVRAVTFLAPDRTPLAHAGPTMLNPAPLVTARNAAPQRQRRHALSDAGVRQASQPPAT
jgi:two-component system sensor histidine kinase BarA